MANCAPGIYSQDQIITLMDPSGRTIRYTTDGTDPTLTSKVVQRADSAPGRHCA
ncbi:MAG: chitobiase/beta-hexosaminidase C-terminal domain-containing protein [Blautia sp.]